MMEFKEIHLSAITLIIVLAWIYGAWKDNGKFTKKEVIQLFLILITTYVLCDFEKFGLAGLAIVLGSLLISEGMEVFKFSNNGGG